LIRWILLVLVAVVGVGGGLVARNVSGLYIAASPGAPERTFSIGEGEALTRVAQRLDREGFFPGRLAARVWTLYARAKGLDRSVKSGEYDLSPSLTPIQILEKLASGQVKTYAVTFPEGSHVLEIAAKLEAAEITSRDAVVEKAFSPEFARSLGVQADSLEGYLFPETYRFRKNTPAEVVLRDMVEQLDAKLTPEDREKVTASGMSLHDVITLASIVEKETGASEERPLIAAVFHNRLARRMRLQSDPTVIYGILRERGLFDGNIRKVDLTTDSPYNTYTRGGLPAGPIASVGIDSIRAVLAPADVKYLYFVSRGNGTHYFSNTLEQHNEAVRSYQLRRGS